MEECKDVVGYENLFSITRCGKLFSKRTKKFLKQHLNKNGYFVCTTRIGGRKGKCECLRIHRLVATTYLDNPENKPMINHKDGNKQNNHVDNLEWVTNKENINHAVAIGLINNPRGEACPVSTITDEIAMLLYTLYVETGCTLKTVSELTGISYFVVRRVASLSSTDWRHIRE